LLLEICLKDGVPARIAEEKETLFLICGEAIVNGQEGTRVSLIPISEKAERVTLKGFLYPLSEETLWRGKTRGISNRLIESRGIVRVESGILLAVVSNSPEL